MHAAMHLQALSTVLSMFTTLACYSIAGSCCPNILPAFPQQACARSWPQNRFSERGTKKSRDRYCISVPWTKKSS